MLLFAALIFKFPAQEAAKIGLWWITLDWSLRRFLISNRNSTGNYWIFWITQTLLGVQLVFVLVLNGFFGAMPQPTVIAQALSNTNSQEISEFIIAQRELLIKAGMLFLMALAIGRYTEKSICDKSVYSWKAQSVSNKLLVILIISFSALLHFNPTMMRSHPLFHPAVLAYRYVVASQQVERIAQDRLRVDVAKWDPKRTSDIPRTVILVIGESSNRANWGLYGYARDTTRELIHALNEVGGEFVYARRSFSTEAFTLASLKQALVPSFHSSMSGSSQDIPDIFQLAQAAGYETAWLSTQPAGEGWFAAIASSFDYSAFTNSGNWRDSSVTDFSLINELRKQLKRNDRKFKLIVLHTLGQHFFYDQRCPPGKSAYVGVEDVVTEQLRRLGRSSSTIEARNSYDSAIACGAFFLAEVLREARNAPAGREVIVHYFSDHGQEVGHNSDVASHSSVYESGFTIPMWTWSRGSLPDGFEKNIKLPFVLSDLPQLLHSLLAVRSRLYDENHDFSSVYYIPPEEPWSK